MRFPTSVAVSLRRAWNRLVALAAVTSLGCGAGNIVLSRATGVDTGSLGTPYSCGTGARACDPGASVDPSRRNQSGTRNLPLPACQYGIEQIVIQQVSGTPIAYVQCAAPPNSPGGCGSDPLCTSDAGAPAQ